jgi:PUA domain protein
VGEFNRGSVVIIRDMRNRPIGVGIALFSSQELREVQRGKVIKNIHHMGDKLWSLIQHK